MEQLLKKLKNHYELIPTPKWEGRIIYLMGVDAEGIWKQNWVRGSLLVMN